MTTGTSTDMGTDLSFKPAPSSFRRLNVTSLNPLSVVVKRVCPECATLGNMRLVRFHYDGASPLDRIKRSPPDSKGIELLLCETCQKIDGDKVEAHALHHQSLTFSELESHARTDGCDWADQLVRWVGNRDLLKSPSPRMIRARYRGLYCWLCSPNRQISVGERIALLRRLYTSFHEECWNTLASNGDAKRTLT